jgi:signal transduction histidine kinase
VDIQQINHLLMNIILNAAQAMEGQGDLRISTTHLAHKGTVRIDISDTGPGIPADILPHILEPFFTTKEEGQGTGLGLSLAYSIVENHGGVIKADNRLSQGTAFTNELPLSTADSGGLNGADREQQS